MFILEGIIIFYCWCLYDILCLILSFPFPPGFNGSILLIFFSAMNYMSGLKKYSQSYS